MKHLARFAAAALLVLAAAAPTRAEPGTLGENDEARIERQRERIVQRLRERGLALPSGSAIAIAAPSGSGSAAPAPSGSAAVRGAADELARRWGLLSQSRLERRERHRAALVRELGQRLSDPRVKDELKLHVTRVAELARLQFLAENARSGAERDKLLARIAKLSAREKARHHRSLSRLSAAPAPSAPAPSVAPPPGAAP